LVKAIPLPAWAGPMGSRKLRLQEFLDSQQMKLVRLSTLCTSCLYVPGNICGTHVC